MKKKQWFKRRRYGWGWMPISWEGWLAILWWVAIVIFGIPALIEAPEESTSREVGIYVLAVILATLVLIRIGYARGPSPKWRWGKKPDDNYKEDY